MSIRSCPICDYEIEDAVRGCPRHEFLDADTLGGDGQRKPPERDAMVGTTIGDKYAVTHILGRGAMGTVYKATQLSDGKDVAIKVLHTHLATEPESIKRFHAEARAASSLMHANIVRIYDLGVTATGAPYIAMELLEGKTLSDFIKERQYLDTREALPIMRQTCEALAEAHSHGVLHRDIKPANIMLLNRFGQDNFVMVLDFSIAKVIQKVSDVDTTAPGLIFGSPAYMSPERFMGKGGDFRSDIYAMGIIMFQLLAGRPPFKSTDLYNLMNEHIQTPPPRVKDVRPDADVPQMLEETIARALAKKPEDRHPNMKQLLAEINEVYRIEFQPRDMYVPPAAADPFAPAPMEETVGIAAGAPATTSAVTKSADSTGTGTSASYPVQNSSTIFDINAGGFTPSVSFPTYGNPARRHGLDESIRTKVPAELNASGRWDKSLISGSNADRQRPVIRHKETSNKFPVRALALCAVILTGVVVFALSTLPFNSPMEKRVSEALTKNDLPKASALISEWRSTGIKTNEEEAFGQCCIKAAAAYKDIDQLETATQFLQLVPEKTHAFGEAHNMEKQLRSAFEPKPSAP